jgi:hypothetical protein
MARGIIFKDNGIISLGNSPTGYKYVGYDNGSLSEKNGATVSSIGGSVGKLLVRGFSGDDPGSATTMVNTLTDSGGSPITVNYTGSSGASLKINLSDVTISRNNSLVFVSMEQITAGQPTAYSVSSGVITIDWNGNIDDYYKVSVEVFY